MLSWVADVLHIHNKVVKSYRPFSEEDKRFLALALCGEVGELANLIKKDWRGDEGDRYMQIADELADVRIYLELLARVCKIDLDLACETKVRELYKRWPHAREGRP